MTIFLQILKLTKLVMDLRKEVMRYHFFIPINKIYNFTFGMTVHGTSKKKLSKNIILMPKFNFEFLRIFN